MNLDITHNNTKNSSLSLVSYFYPLRDDSIFRKISDTQPLLEVENEETSPHDFKATDLTQEVINEGLKDFPSAQALSNMAVTVWAFGSNSKQLIELYKELQIHNYLENYQLVTLPQQDLRIQQEILQDIRRQLIAVSVKASVCFLQILKIGTLPLEAETRIFYQNLLNGGSHVFNIMAYATLEKPEFTRNPQSVTWKDTAHKVFKISVSVLSLAANAYNVAHSLGLIEEAIPLKLINPLATLCVATDGLYGLLQYQGFISKRSY